MNQEDFGSFSKNKMYFWFAVILCCWVFFNKSQFLIPVVWEELDYVGFLWQKTIKDFLPNVFMCADGHPPLLSFISSVLIKLNVPIFVIRSAIFLFLVNGLRFCMKFAENSGIGIFFALFLIFVLINITSHRFLMTSFIGDLGGMVYLFGWAYYREKKEYLYSILCLCLALGIRETHVIVPIAYLVVDSLSNKHFFKKEWLVEIIPLSLVVIYYSISKYMLGSFYPFASKGAWSLNNFLKPIHAVIYLGVFKLLLLYSFSLVVIIFKRPKRDRNVFASKFFYSLILISSLIALVPYMMIFPKIRLLSPYFLVFTVPFFIFVKIKNNKTDYYLTAFGILVLLLFSYADSFITNKNFVEHSRETKEIIGGLNRIFKIKKFQFMVPWPYETYFRSSDYGHIVKDEEITKFLITSNNYNQFGNKIQNPLIIVRSNYDPNMNNFLQQHCFLKNECQSFKIKISGGDTLEFFYKNINSSLIEKNFSSMERVY